MLFIRCSTNNSYKFVQKSCWNSRKTFTIGNQTTHFIQKFEINLSTATTSNYDSDAKSEINIYKFEMQIK